MLNTIQNSLISGFNNIDLKYEFGGACCCCCSSCGCSCCCSAATITNMKKIDNE